MIRLRDMANTALRDTEKCSRTNVRCAFSAPRALSLPMSHKRLCVGLFLLAFVASCASYTDKTAEMREEYTRGNYDQALKALKDSGEMERSQDRLLWRLEAGSIYDRKADYSKSRSLFLEADSIADELYTTSISKTVQSFVVSDSSSDYEGEDYEKVAIHTIMAHQYIALNRLDEARVEARKIGTRLAEINQRYDAEHKNKYGEDAYGRYLSGIIYEAKEEWDNAIIEYWKAIELYEKDFKSFVQGGVPKELVKACYRILALRHRDDRVKILKQKYPRILTDSPDAAAASLTSRGEIIAVHELGRITPKTTGEFFVPVGSQVVRISFPRLQPKSMYVGQTGLQVSGPIGFVPAENTAYMDEIASETLENRRLRLIAKSMARLLIKGQLNEQARQNFGPLGGILANVVTAATETADTRSWTLLPHGFFVSRVQVPPGEYQVSVKTGSRTSQIRKVTVRAGQSVILRGYD